MSLCIKQETVPEPIDYPIYEISDLMLSSNNNPPTVVPMLMNIRSSVQFKCDLFVLLASVVQYVFWLPKVSIEKKTIPNLRWAHAFFTVAAVQSISFCWSFVPIQFQIFFKISFNGLWRWLIIYIVKTAGPSISNTRVFLLNLKITVLSN